MNESRILLISVLVAALTGIIACGGDDHTAQDALYFEYGGQTRSYLFYEPEGLPAGSPLLVVLHGRGQTSESARNLGFDQLADKRSFAVAYPQGIALGDEWTDWNSSNVDAASSDADDVGFLSALATHLQKEHALSADRTFVTGFSAGGYMAYTLACLASDVFHAAAPVAALIDAGVFKQCTPPAPMPILHIHGTKDWLVPITGNPKDGSPSVAEIIAFWVKLNGCTEEATESISSVTTAHYHRKCTGGAEVHYYEMEGQDHIWPGQSYEKEGYEDVSGINATEVIWDFFSNYQATPFAGR